MLDPSFRFHKKKPCIFVSQLVERYYVHQLFVFSLCRLAFFYFSVMCVCNLWTSVTWKLLLIQANVCMPLLQWICYFSVGIKLCAKHKKAEIARNQGGPPIVGAFLPSCKLNGDYEEVQCHGSTGYCWCVDKLGNELPRTRTRGEPNCNLPGMT